MDAQARHNTPSADTAVQIFPMLPEKLSTNFTSPNFNEDRLVVVVEMAIGTDGSLQDSDISTGRVSEAVTATSGLDENLRLQDRAAQRMKDFRHIHSGAEPLNSGRQIKKREEHMDSQTKISTEEAKRGLPVDLDNLSPDAIQGLLHELRIYQIELELQNDELRKTQNELEVTHKKYSNLYEFAPVGYFTLNQAGLIEDVNLAGATLLGTARTYVINRAFSEFVYPEDQDAYYLNLRKFFRTPDSYSVDIRLLKPDHAPLSVRLVCLVIQNDKTKPPQCLIVAMDLTELRQREEEALILAATHERERLARDLHDAVSQTLFAATVTAEALPQLWDRSPERVRDQLVLLHQLSKGALAEMRALLLELRPTALLEADLKSLLNYLVDAIKSRKHIAFSLEIQPDLILPPTVKLAFYRIAQEALNNVVKYACAKHVIVRLVYAEDCLELLIQDDGQGFELQSVLPTSLGLKIMRERAEAISASLTIASEIKQGTCVKVIWCDRVSE